MFCFAMIVPSFLDKSCDLFNNGGFQVYLTVNSCDLFTPIFKFTWQLMGQSYTGGNHMIAPSASDVTLKTMIKIDCYQTIIKLNHLHNSWDVL